MFFEMLSSLLDISSVVICSISYIKYAKVISVMIILQFIFGNVRLFLVLSKFNLSFSLLVIAKYDA